MNKVLFQAEKEKFDGDYTKYLFEQYKIYIKSVNHNSQRRQKTNDFFLALNTGLIAVLAIVHANYSDSTFILTTSSLLGMIICFFWFRLIKAYKMKNSCKFKVIHKVEKELPLGLYSAEWEVLKNGKDPKTFTPFTAIELKIPWIFMAFYLVMFIWSLNMFF